MLNRAAESESPPAGDRKCEQNVWAHGGERKGGKGGAAGDGHTYRVRPSVCSSNEEGQAVGLCLKDALGDHNTLDLLYLLDTTEGRGDFFGLKHRFCLALTAEDKPRGPAHHAVPRTAQQKVKNPGLVQRSNNSADRVEDAS